MARTSYTWKPSGETIDKDNIELNKNNLADFLVSITSKDVFLI